ncbi:MAG: hypothetical protein VKJ05_00900 [Synechococcaceae cyanobacterium]|nr:hypothetical protein [Synechococcaceae cyanobacterium]
MKRVLPIASLASAVLGVGLGLATPEAKALCLAGSLPSPCSSGVPAADLRPPQSLKPLSPAALAPLSADLAITADPPPLAAASHQAASPSLTYSLRDLDAPHAQPARGGASMKVLGAISPMVRVQYQIDAAPASAGGPAPGDGLQIVIDSAAAAPQVSQQAEGSGGALPLAESSRTGFRHSLRSGEEEGFDALAPLALLGGGLALVLSSRPRGSMRPGI